MNLVAPLPATLAGLAVLLLPGLAVLSLLGKGEREELGWDEALFWAVAVSVMAASWTGLVLAELGLFSLVAAGALLAAASALALLLGRGRAGFPLPGRWKGPGALLVLALAFSLQARPSEYLVGGRDPGAYVAAMGTVARTGGLVYADPAVLSIPREDVELFYRHPDWPRFSWARFMGFDLESPQTGRVVPQFFHLFPVFGAYLFQAMGVKGALATPPVFGILGTLAVYFTLRALFGAPAALLGALLLGGNVVQVWFARYPVSEGVSQFLLFSAFLAVVRWERGGGALFAALAGVALGLSLLVRIDSVLVLLPLALYLLLRGVRGDLTVRRAAPLLVPFLLLGAHAALHAALFAPKYVRDVATRRYWNLGLLWLPVAVLALAALALLWRRRTALGTWLAPREGRLRSALALAVVVLAVYAWALRPELSAWAGGDGNDPARARGGFASLDRDGDARLTGTELGERANGLLAAFDADRSGFLTRDEWRGEPPRLLAWLGFPRLAAHDAGAFRRLGWFVTPLGLLLGVAGLVLALRDWRPAYLFPLATGLTFAGFYLYKIRVYNDYFFALRRFVPVVLPLLLGLTALALVRLAGRGRARRAAAAALALFLLGSFAGDTARLARHVDWKGAVRFVADVSRRFGPRDVVVFEQPRSIHLLSLPLWAIHGANVLELARFNPDPERLDHLLRAWRSRWRNVYFVHTYRTDLCGVFLQTVDRHSFGTHEWERAYDHPPRRPVFQALHFTVSRLTPPEELQVPPIPEVDVGGSDDFRVSGFFDREGGGDETYRWTGSCASVYMPGLRPGARLTIRAGVGRRPDSPEVRVSLSGEPLGSFQAGGPFADHVLRAPDPLPPGPPVLRLDVKAWRPANVEKGSSDVRDLGVMLDRVGVGEDPGRATVRGRSSPGGA